MNIDLIGWDIGGAHLKAAALAGGRVVAVTQKPCPLWQGLEHFHRAAAAILEEFSPTAGCRHAVTMTGELVDLFANRTDGVFSLLAAMGEHARRDAIEVFCGRAGMLPIGAVTAERVADIASANWLATGLYAASRIPCALLIDIGSTTTDLLLLRDGEVLTRGYSDDQRMRHDELVYSGIIRTSLMAVSNRAPFEGEWVGLMAEHFATTADVYRLTGELPPHADQAPAADGADKSLAASARRIARMLGRDLESANMEAWVRLAAHFRERQLRRLGEACERQLSRGLLGPQAPFIGAGVGRFLVQELAYRLQHPYRDFVDLFSTQRDSETPCFHIADCAPAVAVACLSRQQP